jgi:acetyl-CoA C-acetyltransferase
MAEALIIDAVRTPRGIGKIGKGALSDMHPQPGATGAMLIGTMLDELERRGLKRGLVTMCAAGGMAPAIII